MSEQRDRKIKIVSLTNYLIELYNPWKSIALMLLASGIAGLIGGFIIGHSAWAALEGIFAGLFFLALPGIATAYLTMWATRALKKELILRRSAYLAFFSTLILSVIYAVGSVIGSLSVKSLFDLLIFGYALIFAIRTFVLMITRPYSMAQAIPLSLIHTAAGFIVIAFSSSLAVLLPTIPFVTVTATLLLMKFAIALGALLIGTALFIVLINAPMKRNFGLSTFELAGVFLAHWFDQSSAIEEVLKSMSEKVNTLVGIVAFRTKRGIKALFIIPYLHPGPFGEVGGGRMTRIFTQTLEKESGGMAFIPHGIATHDLNPVSSDTIYDVAEQIVGGVGSLKWHEGASKSMRAQKGVSKILGQKFGDSIFMASTFSPQATEDIDFSIGLAVINQLKKDHANVIYADCHNCHQKGDHAILSGDPVVFDLLDATSVLSTKLKREKTSPVRMGVAKDAMADFSLEEGVGPTGLRVAAVEAGRQRTAYVIFDANNMMAGLREDIIAAVKKEGFDEVEVMTTDSHCVNSIRGVENPLGMHIDKRTLVRRAAATAKKALEDIEGAEVGTKMIRVDDVEVMGAQKSAELVSTINSMIAMMKIMSPIIFFLAIVASLLGVMFVPW
jgi:putative membrane protein